MMKPGEAGRRARKDGTPITDLPMISFADTRAWSRWLASHHASSRGVWLKIAKKGSEGKGRRSMVAPESSRTLP
jgi:uncharacterized protein YdeI (YjbR/CyaY-like superfamily)